MSGEFVDLDPGEEEIQPPAEKSDDELLFRQIPDHSWDADYGQPASSSFGPMPIDEGKPSFSRGNVVTAQESRTWHNANARSASRGVWACSVTEVLKAGTRSVDDSAMPVDPDHPRAPGHAYVDYRHLGKARKVVRAHLLMAALKRGEIPTAP